MRFIACRVISNTYNLFPEEYRRDYVVVLSMFDWCRFSRNFIRWHEMKMVMCSSIRLWLCRLWLPHRLFVINNRGTCFFVTNKMFSRLIPFSRSVGRRYCDWKKMKMICSVKTPRTCYHQSVCLFSE